MTIRHDKIPFTATHRKRVVVNFRAALYSNGAPPRAECRQTGEGCARVTARLGKEGGRENARGAAPRMRARNPSLTEAWGRRAGLRTGWCDCFALGRLSPAARSVCSCAHSLDTPFLPILQVKKGGEEVEKVGGTNFPAGGRAPCSVFNADLACPQGVGACRITRASAATSSGGVGVGQVGVATRSQEAVSITARLGVPARVLFCLKLEGGGSLSFFSARAFLTESLLSFLSQAIEKKGGDAVEADPQKVEEVPPPRRVLSVCVVSAGRFCALLLRLKPGGGGLGCARGG
jgi:hypothetical protein